MMLMPPLMLRRRLLLPPLRRHYHAITHVGTQPVAMPPRERAMRTMAAQRALCHIYVMMQRRTVTNCAPDLFCCR